MAWCENNNTNLYRLGRVTRFVHKTGGCAVLRSHRVWDETRNAIIYHIGIIHDE